MEGLATLESWQIYSSVANYINIMIELPTVPGQAAVPPGPPDWDFSLPVQVSHHGPDWGSSLAVQRKPPLFWEGVGNLRRERR